MAACGLAAIPLRVFVVGLTLGSAAFLAFHFTAGYLGSQLLVALGPIQPWPTLGGLVALATGFVVWLELRRRAQPGAAPRVVLVEAFGSWHEATCPACLALGVADHALGTHTQR